MCIRDRTETVITPPLDQGPATLDGYSVTSLARKNAIISGPGGSRMVRDKQVVRLGGTEWTVGVSTEGVSMTSGGSRVLLVFDRSLSAPGTSSSSSSGSSLGTSSSSSTPSTTSSN